MTVEQLIELLGAYEGATPVAISIDEYKQSRPVGLERIQQNDVSPTDESAGYSLIVLVGVVNPEVV